MFRQTDLDFCHLRDVLTPRLIEFGEEPKLIELLMDIDDRHTAWSYLVVVLGDREERFDPDVFQKAATDTLRALIELYRYLAAS